MTPSGTPLRAKGAFQIELEVFGRQFKRLANCLMNKAFELTVKGARRRNQMLVFLFLAIGALFVLAAHSPADWRAAIGSLFAYFLDPTYARTYPDIPTRFLSFVLSAFLKPETLRYLPVLLLPFIIALQAAASYLDDIFELQDVNIAREFILQVALTGGRESIRIRGGEVATEDLNSPINKIGGPGQVEVELDTVALFERPDGRPHVIGPTVKGKATLEGFERLRQAIDLRDQYPDALQVTSRSLDGIPVSTVDVRMLFSIWREDKPSSTEHPHPFSEKAVEELVYNQTSRVTIGERCPSAPPEYWTKPSLSLIRGELGGFMGKHRLVEYLASIGTPEIQQADQRESEIHKAKEAVIPDENSSKSKSGAKIPDFHPRHEISSLFSQFAKEFTEKASKRGLELHWVGIGTWKMPTKITDEVITGKHLEAWRLSSENIARGNKDALNELRQEAHAQQINSQIQNIPLARFNNSSDDHHERRVQDLMVAYREQLIEAVELLRKSKKQVPGSIYQAIEYLDKILGYHWVR